MGISLQELLWRLSLARLGPSRDVRKLTRGYFDVVKREGDVLRVDGWMLRIDRAFTELELRVGGRTVARQRPLEMDQVAQAIPWIPHARHSGFSFRQPAEATSGSIDVIGLSGGRQTGRLHTLFPVDPGVLGPLPPADLRLRVAGIESGDFFRADGQRTYADFAAAVERHGGFGGVRRTLDWGCGCARVTAYFLADPRFGEVHGTDIDGEATGWCAANLPQGHFQQTGPYPPLPFPDEHFDLVIAYSVFTHLPRELQGRWLSEMARVLRPGGLLLATVHGEFAALFHLPRPNTTFWDRIREHNPSIPDGILDSIEDHALDGIAPPGYYRGVFQSRKYTVREWSRYLPVVEFRDAGIANYQALVVMRKPA